MQFFMLAFMFMGPLLSACGFIYFAISDPDKLRSEQYELRKTALSMIEEKGDSIPIEATSVEAIANLGYSTQEIKQLESNHK